MSFVLDQIIRKIMTEGPLTISSDFTSDYVDISGSEESVSIQLIWSDGVTPDIDYGLEVSNDGTNWVEIAESFSNDTNLDGVGMFDLATIGVTFIRVKIKVNAGQVDIQEIVLSAKRRH